MVERFEAFVHGILLVPQKKRLVLLITLLAFILSVLMFPTKLVLAKMLPSKSTNTFSIYVDLPNGSSYLQSNAINRCVVELLQKEKEIDTIEVFNAMGSPLDYAGLVKGSGLKTGEHQSEIVVNLMHEHKERSYAMVHRLRPILQHTCEPMLEKTSIKMVEQPAGPPTMAAIVVELYGEDTNALNHLAQTIKSVLKQTKDVSDVDVLADTLYEKLSLTINQEKASRFGLDMAYIHKMVTLAFEGMPVAYKTVALLQPKFLFLWC